MKRKDALNNVIQTLQQINGNTPNRGKTSKKGEQNTLAEGTVRKLRVGDFPVDILAKIYILLKKQYDDDKKDFELGNIFEAERERESRTGVRNEGEGRTKASKVKENMSFMDILKGLLVGAGLGWLFSKGGSENPLNQFAKDVITGITKWAGGLVVESLNKLSTYVRDGWNDLLAKLNLNLPKITPGNLALPGPGMIRSGAAGAKAGGNAAAKIATNQASATAAKVPPKGPDRLSSFVGTVSSKEEKQLKSKGYAVNKKSGRLTKNGKFVGLSETENVLGRAAPALQGAATSSKMTPAMIQLADRMRSCAEFLKTVAKYIEKIPGLKSLPVISLLFNTADMMMDDMQSYFRGEMSPELFKKRATQAFAYAITTLLASEAGAYVGGMVGAFIGALPASTGIGAAVAVVTTPLLAVGGAIAGGIAGPQVLAKIGGQKAISDFTGDYLFGKDDEILNKTPQAQNIPNMPTSEKEKQSLDYFVGKGWSQEQAAGIVNNLKAENSTFDPHLQNQSGSNAYGIAQWMPARQKQFEKLYGKPLKGSSFEEQLGFVNYELTSGDYKGVGDKLRATKSASDASKLITKEYEIPAITDEGLNKEANRRASLLNTNSSVLADNNLKVPDFTPPKPSNQPIIVNAPTNNSVTNNNGGGSGGGMVEARPRNDDAILLKSQYGFHRTV